MINAESLNLLNQKCETNSSLSIDQLIQSVSQLYALDKTKLPVDHSQTAVKVKAILSLAVIKNPNLSLYDLAAKLELSVTTLVYHAKRLHYQLYKNQKLNEELKNIKLIYL